MDDTDRILHAIEKSTEATKQDLGAIWKELKSHSDDIAELKSTSRLQGWKITAIVSAIGAFGYAFLKAILPEKVTKLLGL
jgi:hypothetical protein